MKRTKLLFALPLVLGLSACATDGYYGGGARFAYGGGPYAYDGWYDGYYGPIYDGYWGRNGYFYYRGGAGDRYFRRGDRYHFHRGLNAPRSGFGAMRGTYQGGAGVRAPHFPGGGRGGFRGGHHR